MQRPSASTTSAPGSKYAHLNDAQCATVIQDAAAVVQAVVALDHRYRNIPGWELLSSPGRLLTAAEDCALLKLEHDSDNSVDHAGWQPRLRFEPGPLEPGLAGMVKGTRNLLVGLQEIPTVHNFRTVLEAQRIASSATARTIGLADPSRARTWHRRSHTYQHLVALTRDVAGNLGHGRAAAGHAAILARHVRTLEPRSSHDGDVANLVDDLFAQIDARLADLFAQGAREKLYFLRVPLPSIDETKAGLIKHPHESFESLTTEIRRDFVTEFQTALHPRSPRPSARRTPASTTRKDLGVALADSSSRRSDAITM